VEQLFQQYEDKIARHRKDLKSEKKDHERKEERIWVFGDYELFQNRVTSSSSPGPGTWRKDRREVCACLLWTRVGGRPFPRIHLCGVVKDTSPRCDKVYLTDHPGLRLQHGDRRAAHGAAGEGEKPRSS